MPRSDRPSLSLQTPSSAVLQGALAVGVLSVSTAAVLIRLAGTAPAAIAFWRLLLALGLLMPGIWRRRFRAWHEIRSAAPWIGLSGAFLALHFLTWIQSLTLIPVAASTALVSCHPLFVAGYERLVRQQRLSRATVAGGLVTIAGLFLITASSRFHVQSLMGMALALLGALFAAGYLIVGQRVRQTLDTSLYAPSVYSAATILLGAFQWERAHTFGPLSPHLLFIYLLLAILPTLGGHTLFNWILKFVPASTVSLAFLGEIAGAAVIAWLVLGQVPPALAVVGIATIIAGLVIAIRGLMPTQDRKVSLPPDPTGFPGEGTLVPPRPVEDPEPNTPPSQPHEPA